MDELLLSLLFFLWLASVLFLWAHWTMPLEEILQLLGKAIQMLLKAMLDRPNHSPILAAFGFVILGVLVGGVSLLSGRTESCLSVQFPA